MALESLRDPLQRLNAIPVSANIAYDYNNLAFNDMRWYVDRQYFQNDIVVVEDEGGLTSAYVLAGVTSLLGGSSPDTAEAWQWVSMGGYKTYPTPPSTLSVVAKTPNISFAAWQNAARVGRK